MANVQGPDGSVISFPEGMGDDDINREMMKHYSSVRPDLVAPRMAGAPNMIQRQELQNPRSPNFAGRLPDLMRQAPADWGEAGPGEIYGGAKDIYQGNYARGANRILSGAEMSALPAAPFVAAAAPMAVARGMAGGYIGSKVAGAGAEAFEATPEQQDLASNIGGLAGGGLAASSYGPRIGRAVGRGTLGALERTPIVGPMGKGFVRGAMRSWRGSAPEPTVYPGAPYPEAPPPVYPGAPLPEAPPPTYPGAPLPARPPLRELIANRGVFPGAPEPTATPEQLNPSLISQARAMPGQISSERIFGPRPTPAAPIPARPGLALPGEVAGPQTAAPPPTAPGPPESIYPPEGPNIFPEQPPQPLPPAPGGFQAMREDQSLAERIRDQAYQEDRARMRQKLQEESPVTPKTSLIEQVRGEQAPPVKLTTTKQPRARLKDAMKAPEGTTVPQTSEDMTEALQRSLERARPEPEPVYPGAPYPEAPPVYPGAPYPEPAPKETPMQREQRLASVKPAQEITPEQRASAAEYVKTSGKATKERLAARAAKTPATPAQKSEPLFERATREGAQPLTPSTDVPQKGANFEGRYLKSSLQSARDAWKPIEQKYDDHTISWNKDTDYNRRHGIQVNMHDPDGNYKASLVVRKLDSDTYQILAKATERGSKYGNTAEQVLDTVKDFSTAKKIAEARLRSGQVYEPDKTWNRSNNALQTLKTSEVSPHSQISPETQKPSGFTSDRLVVKIPGDGTFVVRNHPAALDRAIKGAENFVPEKEPSSYARRIPKGPAELDPERLITYWEREIANLQDQIDKAYQPNKADLLEELKGAKENLEDAQSQTRPTLAQKVRAGAGR